MDLLILKNKSVTDILSINDLGTYLNPGETTNLITNFDDEQILESTDLEGVMQTDAEVTLNGTVLSYQDVIDYFTKLSRYDKIDYTYISGKDADTDVTGAELERLTNGSDVSSGTALHNHDSRYYTKTQLNNSNAGTVAIHWDNLTNVPSFGSMNWKDPVDRTNSGYGSGSSLPTTGNALNDARMVRDDGDGKPAQYICVAVSGLWSDQWKKIADVDWGAANAISSSASGNLTSTNVQSALEELQSDINSIVDGTTKVQVSMQDAYDHGSTVSVSGTDVAFKLSDSKSFKIQDQAGTTDILKVNAGVATDTVTINGDTFLVGKLTASGKFDISASESSRINVTNGDLTLGTTSSGNVDIFSAGAIRFNDANLSMPLALSDVGTTGLTGFTATSIVGALNELKNMDAATTLQQAYEGAAGSGAGRTITADFGAVKITATNNFAPLELTPATQAPTAGLAAGQIANINGELFAYDGTRAKWLSMTTMQYTFNANSVNGQMLQIGDVINLSAGHRMPEKATIVKLVITTTGGDQNKVFELRKNSVPTAIKTMTLSSGNYTSTNDNIALNVGDVIQIFATANGQPAKNVIACIYVKWTA